MLFFITVSSEMNLFLELRFHPKKDNPKPKYQPHFQAIFFYIYKFCQPK
jgi:hypothetical protein